MLTTRDWESERGRGERGEEGAVLTARRDSGERKRSVDTMERAAGDS